MAKKANDIPVEEKLRALYDLQIIDSRLDEIRNTRGELPIEVEDLEIDIEGLEKRAAKFDADIKEQNAEINEKKEVIAQAENLIKKYKSRTVVDHVSIEVKQGEIVGLLGPNGAGKTTSFYMQFHFAKS